MNKIALSVFIMVSVLSGCYYGEELYIEPECETIVLQEYMQPKSILVSRHFNGENDSFSLHSSTGQVYQYMGSSYKSMNILSECDSTDSYESVSTSIESSDVAPRISAGLWYRFDDEKPVPIMSLIIGTYISYTNTNDMTAVNNVEQYPTNNEVNYYETLTVMDTTYNEVYLIENNDPLDNQIQGIVYSINKGILGFYRDTSTYWKTK